MPAYSTYSQYAEFCRANGITPIERKWYDLACRGRQAYEHQNDIQLDYDTEARDGWLNERNLGDLA